MATLADAMEEAQSRIASLLQHPDDLTTKLPSLRAKLAMERNSIRAVLKSSVQSQLEDIQSGLFLLSNASPVIRSTKESLGTIDRVCTDAKAVIMNYPRIKKVSRTHQNFIAAKNVVDRFQALTADIERLSAMLSEDSADLMGDAPNLLRIHHELFRLEEFRDQTVQKAKSQGPAVVQIVAKYFQRLDMLVESFREYLWSLAKLFVPLVKADRGSVVVRVAKIVDVEERADERVLVSEQARTSNPALAEAGQFKTLAENPRTIKNYRSQLLNAIHESITETFYKHLAGKEDDATEALECARFIFDDLALIFDELAPRFPPKYKIFPFFVLEYHRHVYDLCNRLTSRHLETREILYMTSWIRDYYLTMGERIGVSEELLEPRLLDDNESSLTREYIKLIKSKLMEWVDRLLASEAQEFLERDNPPDTDADNMYATASAVILFQMINQQIDIAEDASRGGQLLFDVSVECLQIMNYFQEQQLKVMNGEASKFGLNPELVNPGLAEYVIAWSNNHLRCSEFVQVLQKRLETQLMEKYRADMSKHLGATLDGFMRVAKRGNHILMDIVFRDVTPAFQQLHTLAWYEQPLMPAIVTTLEDYFSDFKKHLQDYLFSKLTTDAMDRFLGLYVESLRGKQVKLKMPNALSLMKQDYTTATQFWSTYKTQKRVKQSFDIIEKLMGLVEGTPTMLFLSWYSVWKTYNDVPLVFVEELWYKRDDLEKSEIKEAIASCKGKAKEGGNTEAVPSVFTKTVESQQQQQLQQGGAGTSSGAK